MDRVLIVGGGIAGLTVAATLRSRGIDCELVERVDAWAPMGAGIVLSVNAMAVLRSLGLDEALVSAGRVLGEGEITDNAACTLGTTNFEILNAEFGPTVALHRAALHGVLLAAVGPTPIAMGMSVEAIKSDSAGVDVRFTDGREERFDLVVGADGLRSKVRSLVFGERRIRYSGYTCWRFVVPWPDGHAQMREMWGRGRRFGVVPIGGDRLYCFAVANAPPGQADPVEGRLARLRERFAGFAGDVPGILEQLTSDDQLIHNDLEELAGGPWCSGRVALVGDAAHAMTPNMGQGAAMALEDAIVLVESLRANVNLADSLTEYESQRKPRVRWVQTQSRNIGRIGQLEWSWLCSLRNRVLRLIPSSAADNALRKLASQPL